MCSKGGKIIASAELLNAPTSEIKLSSWGIPIAKPPGKIKNHCEHEEYRSTLISAMYIIIGTLTETGAN